MGDSEKKKILIVLCPGTPTNGVFNDLENDKFSDQPIYLGGNLRMNAAVYEINHNNYEIIFVIGGSQDKVFNMKDYLIDRDVDEKKVIRIESDPDTQGNLYAFKQIMKEIGNNIEVKILTNKYHEKRARLMAKDILSGSVLWKVICAENILLKFPRLPKSFSLPRKLRDYREFIGCYCWEKRIYYKQHKKDPDEWKMIIHDHKLWNNLTEKQN